MLHFRFLFTVFLSIVLLSLSVGRGVPLFAQEKENQGITCSAKVGAIIEKETRSLADFLNQHFQSDLPTNVLIEKALERYRLFRRKLLSSIEENIIIAPNKIATDLAAERDQCAKLVSEHLRIIREAIKIHVTKNGLAKKTTRFLDRYKEINGKLDKLNAQFGQMYGYYLQLANKLPCYVEKCL